MKIEQVNPADLIPADYNPRTISETQLIALKRSIERWGFVQPVILNEKTGRIVGGHQRVTAALELALPKVPVVRLSLDESGEKALNIALNKISGDWDKGQLVELIEELEQKGWQAIDLGFNDSELDALLAEINGEDLDDALNLYTKKLQIPIYEPNGEAPALDHLFDDNKTQDLIDEIRAADLPDDVAFFLERAAERHTVFDFGKVADYYAHAEPDVQALMERSALVIIDFDQAIENGFVSLSEKMKALVAKDHPDA